MTAEPIEAVVTGAGRGLGRAIAQALTAEGTRVWVCSENAAELAATAATIEAAGGSVRAIETDLADPSACTAFTNAVIRGASRIQVVVNNAAVWKPTPVLEMTLPQWSETLAVMLTAPFIITRNLLPVLQRDGGSVIGVSSRSAVMPFAGEAAYCAAKYGMEAFTQCLALEIGAGNVSVNTITPGLKIKPTSMTDEQIAAVPETERASWHDPTEIMPAFLFLASLRGEITGRRFDALELTGELKRSGRMETLARIDEFYR